MSNAALPKFYSPAEELVNVASHGIGLLLALAGLPWLLWKAGHYGDADDIVAAAVYGISLVLLYAASTVYHSSRRPELRARLRVLDHASIFFLIAGTYTPFTLLVLDGGIGWAIFGAVWGLALTGAGLKLFYTGHYHHLSTVMYLATGWMIVFAIEPLVANLSDSGMRWLIAGGLAYTAGAILYSIKTIPFNHAVFHLFVLAGSTCHFVAIFNHVLPGS